MRLVQTSKDTKRETRRARHATEYKGSMRQNGSTSFQAHWCGKTGGRAEIAVSASRAKSASSEQGAGGRPRAEQQVQHKKQRLKNTRNIQGGSGWYSTKTNSALSFNLPARREGEVPGPPTKSIGYLCSPARRVLLDLRAKAHLQPRRC